MKRENAYIFVEKNNLNYAEHALRKIHQSEEYQQYRKGLDKVKNLDQRYQLANRFRDILLAEYELEIAIQESVTMIQSLKKPGIAHE